MTVGDEWKGAGATGARPPAASALSQKRLRTSDGGNTLGWKATLPAARLGAIGGAWRPQSIQQRDHVGLPIIADLRQYDFDM